VKDLTDTLMERVESLLPPSKPPLEWGNPRLSTTPSSIAIENLALRTEALEDAVREIALRVQTSTRPLEWGNPLLSTTPSSIAIENLALRTEALEDAVWEIALRVQRASDQVQKASDQALSREQE
jgi:hypothetical protein